MNDKLYFCREAEKLWTLEELKRFYETEADRDETWHCGFGAWLNGCMYYNNGTLEEVKQVYRTEYKGKTIFTLWNLYSDLD